MGITITQKGSFNNAERYLKRLSHGEQFSILSKYGAEGVTALSNATPVDSGLTAGSWSYTIIQKKGYFSIRWHNSAEENGAPIAVMLQYGHGTGTGGYVQGRDYIMPAMRPIFDRMLADLIREVTK